MSDVSDSPSDTPSDPSVVEMISLVRQGDPLAASRLVALYEPAIRREIRMRLRRAALGRLVDASDLCQSVFGSFFVRLALGQFALTAEPQIRALLNTMARNKLANQQALHQAARRDLRRSVPLESAGEVADIDITPDRKAETADLIGAVFARLSSDERQLADARAAGQGWSEIGEAWGASPDALRMRHQRTIRRVLDELGLGDELAE